MTVPKYSVIIPVYNRPQELGELLESLCQQTFTDFEVIVVEDGSTIKSQSLVENYSDTLAIHYFFKANSGPGPSRNFGFEKALGDYLVIFDSDCILPAHYFESVENFMKTNSLDAWGGPDRGHDNFTNLQRAMAYTMSSFLTTGGIRGAKKIFGTYQPRSFNMGISKETFKKTGGFHFDRFAEDIELSIRMKKLRLKISLIRDAFVFHKRRATLGQFFQQVSNFGKGRVLVGTKHIGEVKLVHWFPFLFSTSWLITPILFLIKFELGLIILSGNFIYLLLIAFDCLLKTRSIMVSLLSIPAAIVQLLGYGFGFFSQKLKFLWS